MNQKLTEALRRQQIRKMHRSVVIEARVLNEISVYKIFVEPFTDVLDAAKLGAQDLLSTTKFALDVLFAFTPGRLKKAQEKYDKRHKELSKKWEPILKRNQEALSGGDADLIALALNPGLFLASEAAMQVWDKTENIYKFLDEAGWSLPLSSLIIGDEPQKPKNDDKGKDMMTKLKTLFYGTTKESVVRLSNSVILEQDEKKPDLATALQEYLEQTGLKQMFDELGSELVGMHEELLREILEPGLQQLKIITELGDASDPEAFVSLIEKAKNEGMDIEAMGLDVMLDQIEQGAKKLTNTEGFADNLAAQKKEAGGTDAPVEISADEKLKTASRIVFNNAKQNLNSQLEQGKEKLRNQIINKLEKSVPNETSIKAIKGTTKGTEYLGKVEAAKQEIKSA